jgi:epoxyqueuosine reductase
MMIDAATIKQAAGQLGADLCGIAPVSRFSEAPTGFHPRDISAQCASVVVLGARFPLSTLEAGSQAPYTWTARASTRSAAANAPSH